MRSVLAQTYKNWEMILVDDCSSDGTYERAKEIAAKHDNITVLQNEKRLYCGMNYNKMLSMAKGKYCGVVDGDDVLLPQAMSIIVQYYEKYPQIDFMWTKHRWGNTNLDKFREGLSRSARHGTIYDSEEGLRHVYSHWRTFKTELRERKQLFENLKCTVDKNLGYNLEEVGRGGFLNMPLYHYRYHKKNMSHNSNQRQIWREVRIKHANRKRYNSVKLK